VYRGSWQQLRDGDMTGACMQVAVATVGTYINCDSAEVATVFCEELVLSEKIILLFSHLLTFARHFADFCDTFMPIWCEAHLFFLESLIT
jgi:hypothetical protein